MMRKFLLLILMLVPELTVAQPVTGEGESSHGLDPVVVTATARPTALSRTTTGVTIITREQIEAQQAVSVVDVLRQVPGLYVDQPGGRGGTSSVYIRGGDPNFTLILIDGVEVNDPANSRGGSFDFSTLSTDNIERIEIVRAPLSALYGSGAMSGVINIITRHGKAKPDVSFELSGGRFGSFRGLAQTSGLKSIADYSLSASYLDDGEPIAGSEFVSKALSANIGLTLSDDIELRSTLRYADIHSETFPDDSGGPEFAVIRSPEERDPRQFTLGANLTHNPFSWWEYSFSAGVYNNEEDISSPGVAPGLRDPFGIPPSETDTSFTRYEAALINRFTLAGGVDAALGAEWKFEDGSSRGFLLIQDFQAPTAFDLERKTWAPFFEVRLFAVPNLFVQSGIRIDYPEDFDYEISPRLGASYNIKATGTTLRANWGEGFKLPSFFALGNPIVGNLDLAPEKSRSFDIGFVQSLWEDRVSAGAAYFYNEFINLVDFEEGPPPRLVNRSEVISQGVEITFDVRPSEALRLNGHLTYSDTNIKGTEEELRNRPKWFGGFSVWWRPSRTIQINLDGTYAGKVLDSSIPTGDAELDPYARFDIAFTWTAHDNVRLFLAVENLLDADYEQFVGFPAPGINPRGGVQARF